ncbi:MAG TPA: UbiA family prenyltransferase [Pseudomonadales bacterium]|nr:UbiA family prenyltransferase [Pseudomonadales bacterium]
MTAVPLCVDLDGTFLKTDTLYELTVRVLKQQPWLLFLLPVWLLRGKHILKRELSQRCQLDCGLLPANKTFLEFLHSEHKAGRALYLVTGAHTSVARAIAAHYGIFADVFATDDRQNLTGKNKADLLVEKFGAQGFAYAGNDDVDHAVWEKAAQCYLVNAAPSAAARARKKFTFAGEMDLREPVSIKLVLKAIRLHQWAKNALIFVPILAAHAVFDPARLWHTALSFIAFGCCASFSYIINDVGDLDADRKHHSKFRRPFASGALSIPAGLGIALLLILVTVLLSTELPRGFVVCLLVYFFTTNAYTLRLKYVPILDVSILAGLYTLRVLAGSFAAGVSTSFWLLAFSCFIFFSLAIVKRISELMSIETPDEKPVICRGYWTTDTPVLVGLGTSSALMSVLVLALYINSPDIMMLYSSPRYLWLLCPMITLWLGRVWLITGRGQMHDDPVVFALRDRVSWVIFSIAAALMIVGASA